jgi:hypothetical protein
MAQIESQVMASALPDARRGLRRRYYVGMSLLLWFALPGLGIVYDLRRHGRVHPIYWIGVAAMIVAALRIPFSASETWLGISRPIIESLI